MSGFWTESAPSRVEKLVCLPVRVLSDLVGIINYLLLVNIRRWIGSFSWAATKLRETCTYISLQSDWSVFCSDGDDLKGAKGYRLQGTTAGAGAAARANMYSVARNKSRSRKFLRTEYTLRINIARCLETLAFLFSSVSCVAWTWPMVVDPISHFIRPSTSTIPSPSFYPF